MSVPSKMGRVNLMENYEYKSYDLTQRELELSETNNGNIGHYMEENNLTKLFFSKKNVNALQEYIQFKVFSETKRRIGRQSDMQLLMIMRSIFFSNSRNMECDIVPQVRELNEYVIKACIGSIISNMQQYDQYRKDASTAIQPLEHPVFMSEKGRGPNEFPQF